MSAILSIIPKKLNKIFTQSSIDTVVWLKENVYAGFKTDFEVKFSHIKKLTELKVTCWTDDGQQIDFTEVYFSRNKYRGQIFIPNTTKSNTHIHLVVQLPKFNILCKSDSIPVRTSLQMQ